MKKILMLAAIAAFAGAAQAATLSWQLVNNKLPSGDAAANLATFLFVTAQSQDFGATLTSKDAVSAIIESGSMVVVKDSNEKVTGISDGTTTINVAAAKNTTTAGGLTGATGYGAGNWTTGDSLTGFIVMFDASDAASAQNYIVSGEQTATWTGPGGAKTLGFGTVATPTSTWKAVPEPATATLALAGLALLLKRRRA